jgi:hypothetical protein
MGPETQLGNEALSNPRGNPYGSFTQVYTR